MAENKNSVHSIQLVNASQTTHRSTPIVVRGSVMLVVNDQQWEVTDLRHGIDSGGVESWAGK
jgi:hypothetical protein